MLEHTRTMLHRAALGVAGTVIKPRDARMGDGACAHGAWLQRHPQLALRQPFVAEQRSRRADRQDFRMGGGIAQGAGVVVRPGDNPAVMHENRANRHFSGLDGKPRFFKRGLHGWRQAPADHR